MCEIEDTVDGSPDDERPVGAVPQTAQQEDNQLVTDPFGFGDTIATKRDVEIVTEPGGEGDVPTFPEVRYRSREIWEIEVVTKVDTEEFCGAACDI